MPLQSASVHSPALRCVLPRAHPLFHERLARSLPRLYRSRLLRFRRQWSGRTTFGAQCSTGCPKDAAGHFLRLAAGGTALTAGIKVDGCASASRLGSRRLRMRRWRPLAATWPRVVLRACRHARLSEPLGLPWALPRSLAAPFIRVQQAHASVPLGRLCGKMIRLYVRAAVLRTRTLAGGGGLVVVVPRGLRQQCRLGFICLGWSPVIFSFQAVLLRLVHLTL